ncbi:beta-ketoacyl-[acyl-carrier-protein] synthase family protein [Actinoplanes couchii]|uniref:3-oxoacyl-[acyl-carrier-protein] synthase 2 n=1 Tax=Actinoplanes couchii TaxID=403638 RepID=A0ABQ3X1S1_9ACTN|nr:beta-ketoacyl-[acyl-carrier-protein] synthase family protein [Actinoplanes couchii]MDR6316864.1 3-oxoacyl-[acyl-carrier-protein] synthase II [Actinoplanes couchii]GID52471.1 3-oxoacyl-[acyl-carrier-protein] synthase 2 [Actinoplanes couchii]
MSVAADVVVTGMGVVSPAGCDLAGFWPALLAGRSLAAPVTTFDTSRHKARIGCQVAGFEQHEHLGAKEARRMDPFARYALAAALSAHTHAGAPTVDVTRTAVVVGNAVGGRTVSDQESRNHDVHGPARVNPLMPLMTMPNAAAALISMRLGWRGPATTIANTCASGADAIGHAALLLRTGQADIVLAGGAEATLTPVTMAAFGNLGAVSARNDDPAAAARPFDVDRDGFVMGEGAAFVVLERRADAAARGATAHAVVSGYASGSDAYHLSMPRAGGDGAAAVMTAAITAAGLRPDDIRHVNAHGTATPHNDRAEARALHTVFGADQPPVTSLKGTIGHLIGAAGAVEFVATVLALRHGLVPPTANHQKTEPGMDLDVVAGAARVVPAGPALSNSFGFGGHNAALVVSPA